VVDEFTRECLAIDVAGSIRSRRVIDVLAAWSACTGAPLFLRSNNGPKFVCHAILDWIARCGIGTALIDPGKPWQVRRSERQQRKLQWQAARRVPIEDGGGVTIGAGDADECWTTANDGTTATTA